MFNTFADVLTIFTEYPIPSEGSSGNLTPLLVAVELDTIFKCLVKITYSMKIYIKFRKK